jgi:hypothetical protein
MLATWLHYARTSPYKSCKIGGRHDACIGGPRTASVGRTNMHAEGTGSLVE